MTRYRIVTDRFAGYKVQVWRWWLPIWLSAGVHTRPSISTAEEYARGYAGITVKYLGKIE